MSISTAELWFAIAGLAFGSWLLRFSFLGIIGNAELPEWITRHLRYTLVAVLPGIIAPLFSCRKPLTGHLICRVFRPRWSRFWWAFGKAISCLPSPPAALRFIQC